MTATLADTIYLALREQIITGDLPAGDRLRQDHIARAFEASHVPVREALLRLEAHGLAKSEPRRGMRVSALNPAEMTEVQEMRVALEPLALLHAVQKATPIQLKKADELRQLCDAAGDMPTWETRNRAFHMAILAPCDMPRLLATIADLQAASARHLYANWRGRWLQRADKDHAAILQAMTRKDTETAAEVLRRHIRRIR